MRASARNYFLSSFAWVAGIGIFMCCRDSTFSESAPSVCPVGFFECDKGKCIMEYRVCDNVSDCIDQTDEYGCFCKLIGFHICETELDCFSDEEKCNGFPYCEDRTDERDCPNSLLSSETSNKFQTTTTKEANRLTISPERQYLSTHGPENIMPGNLPRNNHTISLASNNDDSLDFKVTQHWPLTVLEELGEEKAFRPKDIEFSTNLPITMSSKAANALDTNGLSSLDATLISNGNAGNKQERMTNDLNNFPLYNQAETTNASEDPTPSSDLTTPTTNSESLNDPLLSKLNLTQVPNKIPQVSDRISLNKKKWPITEAETNSESFGIRVSPSLDINSDNRLFSNSMDAQIRAAWILPKFEKAKFLNCNEEGTDSHTKWKSHLRCPCKKYVTGTRCDKCMKQTIHLTKENEEGCSRCFCMNTSRTCEESQMRRKKIEIRNVNCETQKDSNNDSNSKESKNLKSIYKCSLPEEFLGDKVTSYGGKLTLRFKGSKKNTPLTIIIKGMNYTMEHENKRKKIKKSLINKKVPRTRKIQVKMLENNWKIQPPYGVRKRASREEMLVLLSDLRSFSLAFRERPKRKRHFRIKRLDLEIASNDSPGGIPAPEVEQCKCHSDYTGSSCQQCAPGLRKEILGYSNPDGLYFVCRNVSAPKLLLWKPSRQRKHKAVFELETKYAKDTLTYLFDKQELHKKNGTVELRLLPVTYDKAFRP